MLLSNPLLTETVKKELSDLNKDLFNNVNTDQSIGLYGGLSGMCLYLYQCYKTSGDIDILETLHATLDKLILCLGENESIGCHFSAGMAGCVWMLEYLNEKNIVDIDDEEFFHPIDKILLDRMKADLNNNNIDQLNGAIGIARYL